MFALQIDINDIGPDQIIRSQHIKSGSHACAFEIATHIHLLFNLFNLFFVDKYFQITSVFEINLRRQQCRT